MRMIDADALIVDIKRLKAIPWGNERGDRVELLLNTEELIRLIEHAPTVNSWIPCTERLPEEGLPVVITAQDADGRFVDISIRSDVNYWSGFGRINVLAWMPIPEAYKEMGK